MDVIIVPTDFSDNAERALDQALLLAEKTGSEIEILHTIELEDAESAYFQMRVMTDARNAETRINNLVKRRMKVLGMSQDIIYRVHVHYKQNFEVSIQELIKQTGAKLVVMGSKGSKNWSDKLFGSYTANLIGKAIIPVLCIPSDWIPAPCTRLAVCIEPNQMQKYNDEALAWGKWMDCEVLWLHFATASETVTPPVSEQPFESVITAAEAPLYQRIVDHSRELEATVIAMFVQPRSFFKKLFDPSLTKKTAGLIAAPLLALPGKGQE